LRARVLHVASRSGPVGPPVRVNIYACSCSGTEQMRTRRDGVVGSSPATNGRDGSYITDGAAQYVCHADAERTDSDASEQTQRETVRRRCCACARTKAASWTRGRGGRGRWVLSRPVC
jgi:hypothetical protein